ncbi:MAG TPA: metallopeptidase TldD-related protein [Polyangiaceae bacterium]|nr:metallopeptidase TldD-related protein [Polyangiaceae bacterium]
MTATLETGVRGDESRGDSERTRSKLYRAPFGVGGPAAIDEALAARLLAIALGRGGDYADLFFEYRAAGGFVFDDGILKSASRGVSMGLGVRVQKGDATGYAYVERLDWDAMKRAAETAAQIASGGGSAAPVSARHVEVARRYELDEVTIDVPGPDKRRLLERAAAAAQAYDARIVKVEASLAEEIREILVVTSDGVMVRDSQPLLRFGVRAIAERDGKRQEGSSGGGGRTSIGYFEGKSPEWHAQEAARQAVSMLDAEETPAGQMEVVLAPGDSGILLHEAVGHGLEADFNRKETSNYSGKLGLPVASELCTVVDDATLLQSRGTINVDDEGNEPRSTVLIERGKLVGYMHDRLSARHFHVRPSGNGRRESFSCAPMPRMTNTILLAGPHAPEDILRSVKRGIYAKKFGGGQVDIANGDFVFSLTESYLVEDGKITAPLKGVNLIGNGPDVLRRVTMLGDDVGVSDGIWTCGKDGQSVPVGVGCPTIKIDSITVGGTRLR